MLSSVSFPKCPGMFTTCGAVPSTSPPARGDSHLSPSAVFPPLVRNGLPSACPTPLCWRLRWSLASSVWPPWELSLPLLFVFSQCLCHEALVATHSQKQGLSYLVCSRITSWRSGRTLSSHREDAHLSEKTLLLPLPEL